MQQEKELADAKAAGASDAYLAKLAEVQDAERRARAGGTMEASAAADAAASGGRGGSADAVRRLDGSTFEQTESIVGLLSSVNVWLSQIAYNTAPLRTGYAGSVTGATLGDTASVDRALGRTTSAYRASAGTPRTA